MRASPRRSASGGFGGLAAWRRRICQKIPSRLLGAICHLPSEKGSPRFSSTIRTARARTSGENLFDVCMFVSITPSSQELGPPAPPGHGSQSEAAPLSPGVFAALSMFVAEGDGDCHRHLCLRRIEGSARADRFQRARVEHRLTAAFDNLQGNRPRFAHSKEL